MFIYKVIGALIGFSFGNFLGAVIGWFIGGALGQLATGRAFITPATRQQRQAVFIETVFSLMGCLAKADGRISEEEITHTDNFITQLGMTQQHRQQAIELFKQGSKSEFNSDAQLQKFLASCGSSAQLKRLLLVYLVGVAMADGELHPAEEQLLQNVAHQLGFSPAAFQQMMDMLRGQDHFSGNGQASQSTISDAYQALGVTDTNTDAEIKKAYRKLMSEYHPDKLIGQGLPDDMIKAATVRSQEVQAAYDLVKKHRGK